jgi:hypothetical protein
VVQPFGYLRDANLRIEVGFIRMVVRPFRALGFRGSLTQGCAALRPGLSWFAALRLWEVRRFAAIGRFAALRLLGGSPLCGYWEVRRFAAIGMMWALDPGLRCAPPWAVVAKPFRLKISRAQVPQPNGLGFIDSELFQ